MFPVLLSHLRVATSGPGRPRTRPDKVRGDKAYSSRAIRELLRSRGIQAVIPQPADQIGHRQRRGRAGGRPPGFDAEDYKGRNVVERSFQSMSSGSTARRLLRGAERLTEAQSANLFDKLLTADPGEDIAAAWIAKELLRDLLSCPERGGLRYEIHTALDHFYQFCAACKVPEVIKLARTIQTWQASLITALQTGLTNARTEGYNRIVKHVGHIAFGFRNPDNQRRRVRWACTRQSRRIAPSRHQRHC